MCRMVGLAWWSVEGARLASRLVSLLVEAASRDPYLERIAGDARHCHGYGYAGLVERGGSHVLLWEKYDAADGLGVGEESCRANLEALGWAAGRVSELVASSGRGVLVFHARRAGRGEPRGTVHAHPYLHVVAGRHGYRFLALTHNGGIDKGPLAALLGLDPGAYTDSAVMAAWVARQASYGVGVREALDEVRQYVKSALDVLVVEAWGGGYRLHVYAYLPRGLDGARLDYYRPVFFEAEGVAGYLSSTVADLAEREGLELGRTDRSTEQYHVVEPR